MTEEDCCGQDAKPIEPVGRKFSVEAVATIDDRGQMVLPKAIRKRLGLKAGDKLAISVMERDGKPCCITLIRTEELSGMVREFLGPAIKDLL